MFLKEKNYKKIENEIYQAIESEFERDKDSNADFALNELLSEKDTRIKPIFEFVFEKSRLSNEFEVLKTERKEWRAEMDHRQYMFDNR